MLSHPNADAFRLARVNAFRLARVTCHPSSTVPDCNRSEKTGQSYRFAKAGRSFLLIALTDKTVAVGTLPGGDGPICRGDGRSVK